jgi:poly(hydroxyalkanoate) granule-associated protein
MSDTPETVSPAAEKDPKSNAPILEASRKILLAAVGAMSLTQEAVEDFVEKLIERGEIAEKDGRSLVREIAERRSKNIKTAEEHLYQHFDHLLKKMNIPTKKDIEALNEKVVELTRKIDELKKD